MLPLRWRRFFGGARESFYEGLDVFSWLRKGAPMPGPRSVKNAVLLRYAVAGAPWLETGTHTGDTARFLSDAGFQVHTIEADWPVFERSRRALADRPSITCYHGDSSKILPTILQQLQGNLNVWLDGHWSGWGTHRGAIDTPIRAELASSEAHLEHFKKFSVFVDDVRCFDPENPEYTDYPPKSWLVGWAERLGCRWTIEHDIFIARYPLRDLL